jgi:hypothetical protein
MRPVGNQPKHRLLKWVKWKNGLFKYACSVASWQDAINSLPYLPIGD